MLRLCFVLLTSINAAFSIVDDILDSYRLEEITGNAGKVLLMA